jgi:hypothetical protein
VGQTFPGQQLEYYGTEAGRSHTNVLSVCRVRITNRCRWRRVCWLETRRAGIEHSGKGLTVRRKLISVGDSAHYTDHHGPFLYRGLLFFGQRLRVELDRLPLSDSRTWIKATGRQVEFGVFEMHLWRHNQPLKDGYDFISGRTAIVAQGDDYRARIANILNLDEIGIYHQTSAMSESKFQSRFPIFANAGAEKDTGERRYQDSRKSGHAGIGVVCGLRQPAPHFSLSRLFGILLWLLACLCTALSVGALYDRALPFNPLFAAIFWCTAVWLVFHGFMLFAFGRWEMPELNHWQDSGLGGPLLAVGLGLPSAREFRPLRPEARTAFQFVLLTGVAVEKDFLCGITCFRHRSIPSAFEW